MGLHGLNKQAKILAVDDSTMNHKIIDRLLSEQYNVSFALSGEQCLEEITETDPDLILLDVTMPGKDGYETCVELRKLSRAKDIPIIFLSGRCSIEEKLKGYEVGGDEFITKPFEGEEVLIKIDKCLAYQADATVLQSQVKAVSSVANSALKDNSYFGQCLSFIEQTFKVKTIEDLADVLLDTTRGFGVNATLQIRMNGHAYNFEDDHIPRELEAALISKTFQNGRYVDFGRRTVINYRCVSLLIKNMPLEDSLRYRLIREQSLALLKGAEARVDYIIALEKMYKLEGMLKKLIGKTHGLLQVEDVNNHEVVASMIGIYEDVLRDVEMKFTNLDLEESAEREILRSLAIGLRRLVDLQDNLHQTNEGFDKIVDDVKS